MPPNNELILTTTRIGIVHSPSLPYSVVEGYLSNSAWDMLDPEWCIVTYGLSQPNSLMDFFRQHHMFVSCFHHSDNTAFCEAAYRDMFNYVTHLLIFLRPGDTDFKAYLKEVVPALPKKVVTLTVN